MTWRLLVGGTRHGQWIDAEDDPVRIPNGGGGWETYTGWRVHGELVLRRLGAPLPDPAEVAALLTRAERG